MATEIRSIPVSSTLLKRRSGSRLQLLSEHPTSDAHTQNKGEVARASHTTLTSPLMFTPLTPIPASPVLTPAITTAARPISTNFNPITFPSDPVQSGGGVKHQRSRSTLSRLHVALPDTYLDARRHARSATLPAFPDTYLHPGFISDSPPSPSLFNDIIIVNGVPIAKTPSPPEETPLPMVDFPAVSPRVPRSRSKTARTSFILGSDDEDDTTEQQRREAATKAKKLERHDDLRRYHALMELLKTEVKYLQDLRILVNVCAVFC